MSSDLAIHVEGLGKAYTIKHQQNDHVTLAQVALEKAKHPFRRSRREEFWALQDVSFDVRQGEVLGVIGRNGAGKSTLLKLLTRITGPTAGRIDLWGRVGSLLEVGTGFHPELTGRENIYLNGSILGMSRKEIERQFDAIVDFAGVERFLDTPVKRYSSGMYVRLAFAVAAHLQTEILLIDEVLAVGDQDFQQRCLEKMHDVAVDGRTVLFVSHQLPSVTQLCDRVLLLADGRVAELGEPTATVERYLTSTVERATTSDRVGAGPVHVSAAEVAPGSNAANAARRILMTVVNDGTFTAPSYVTAHIVDSQGRTVAQCDSRLVDVWLQPEPIQDVTLELHGPWLLPGDYRVDLFIRSFGLLDHVEGACTFHVAPELPYTGAVIEETFDQGVVLPDFNFLISASLAGDSPAHHHPAGSPDQ